MPLQIGQNAPDFTLYNTEKTAVSLHDFKGKNVLILFFPLAFTSVCTVELCAVRDSIAYYSNANATVLGISVDSLYALGAFKKDQHLNFPLLSDFNKKVSESYEAIYDTFSYGMKGVSKRAAFIVDKDSKIAYAEVLDNASEQPSFEKISAVLNSLT
jgi:glutaredoxin-dependent peroxiredoxin